MFYVYILESADGDLYYGRTNDLRRRLKEHNAGKNASTKNRFWTLIYYEAYAAIDDACRREKQLKLHGQAKRQLRERVRKSRLGQS